MTEYYKGLERGHRHTMAQKYPESYSPRQLRAGFRISHIPLGCGMGTLIGVGLVGIAAIGAMGRVSKIKRQFLSLTASR